MTAGDTHECPITGCEKRVQAHRLMCGYHWHLVGPNLQSRLYRAWNRGAGQGTDEHAEAMRCCVQDVEWKLMEGAALRAKVEGQEATR